jgi:hypothetical protein
MDPLLFLSAIIGGFFGALFSNYLPQFWFAPRLHIVDIDRHSRHCRVLVANRGRTAAVNAIGRITLRTINEGDIVSSEDAYLELHQWQTGIESDALHWATSPNDMKLTINPKFAERLNVFNTDGQFIIVVSENSNKNRAKLKLPSGKDYLAELVVSAENARPSNVFRIKISTDGSGQVVVSQFSGEMPIRANIA